MSKGTSAYLFDALVTSMILGGAVEAMLLHHRTDLNNTTLFAIFIAAKNMMVLISTYS